MKMWFESLLEVPRKVVTAAALALVFPAGNLMAQGSGSAGISRTATATSTAAPISRAFKDSSIARNYTQASAGPTV